MRTSLDLATGGGCSIESSTSQEANMLELSVKGMTCNGCVTSVTRAIQGVDSKAGVDVDLASDVSASKETREGTK